MMGRNMGKIFKQRTGLGLAELLVVVAVMGLLMAGAFGVLSTSVKSFQHTADQGANVQLARNVLNEITDELRKATSVTIVSASSITYKVSSAAFEESNPNRAIALSANSVVITYKDSAGNTVSAKTLGQGRVGSLQIIQDSTNTRLYTVKISLQSGAYPGAIVSPVSTVVSTLN